MPSNEEISGRGPVAAAAAELAAAAEPAVAPKDTCAGSDYSRQWSKPVVVLFASLPSLKLIAEDQRKTLKGDPIPVEEDPRSRCCTRQATSSSTHAAAA